MNTFDYQFFFNDISDGYAEVLLTKHFHKPDSFEISIEDAPIRLLNDSQLSSLQADLLDLATAIHFADKISVPKKSRSIEVQISLSLRHPEIFEQIHSLIQDLLFWYTKDNWHFQFRVRKSKRRQSECQIGQLNLPLLQGSTEFALWSGGLDSLAGLHTRLFEDKSKSFALIGTGSNSIMRKTQQQVFQALRYLPDASGRLRFLHIPINANYGGRYFQNQSHRARGIVFLLIGAVCALSVGCKQLNVYETGIGAINLPLPGGVGRDHSKAVHPVSLIKMERFISHLIGEPFLIDNPFIFSTKAMMCNSIACYPSLTFETISCDRLHREKYIQCGYCSSCILRRQALMAANIKDQTKYLIPHGKNPSERHLIYWKLMNQQVNTIEDALDSSEPFFNLSMSYPNDLSDLAYYLADRVNQSRYAIEEKIVKLYRTYVREWRGFAEYILDDMTHTKNSEHYLEVGKWQQMQLIN